MPSLIEIFHQSDNAVEFLKRAGRRGRSDAERLLPPSMGWNVPYGSDREKYDDQKAYNYYNSWSYACIRPIAERIASQPFQVGRIVKPGKQPKKSLMRTRKLTPFEMARLPLHVRIKAGLPIVPDFATRLDMITKSLISDSTMSIEVLEEHPILECISDPNERMIQKQLMTFTASGLEMTGKAFWWIIKSKRREGFDLWPLPSTWVSQLQNGKLDSDWEIRAPSAPADPIYVKYERMVYFHIIDPTNPFGAMGPSRACTRAILTDDAIQDSQKSGFDNDMIPGLAVILGEVAAGPDGKMSRPELERWQAEQIEQRLNQLMKGSSKHRKLIILDRMIKDVKRVSFGNTEMDWKESSEIIKKRIFQIYGVNPIVAGEMENANRASAVVAQESFVSNVINPLITLLSQVIEDNLLPYFADDDESLVCWIEEAVAEDPEQKRADQELLFGFSALTVNELRADKNLPPFDGGDVVFVPNTGKFIDPEKDMAKQTEPPAPMGGTGPDGKPAFGKPAGNAGGKPAKPAKPSPSAAVATPDDEEAGGKKKPPKKEFVRICINGAVDAFWKDFDESLHPRDDAGRFAVSGGEGAPLAIPSKFAPKSWDELNTMASKATSAILKVAGGIPKWVWDHEYNDAVHEFHKMTEEQHFSKYVAMAAIGLGLALTAGLVAHDVYSVVSEGLGWHHALSVLATGLSLEQALGHRLILYPVAAGAKLYDLYGNILAGVAQHYSGTSFDAMTKEALPEFNLDEILKAARQFWGNLFQKFVDWYPDHVDEDGNFKSAAGMAAIAWEEDDHPRDHIGRFTDGNTAEIYGSKPDLLEEARTNGGFTYNPTSGKEPKEGLAISPYPERSFAKALDKCDENDILNFIDRNHDLLQKDGAHVGGWVCDGKLNLDVSIVKPQNTGPDVMAQLCAQHDQRGYFDLKNQREVIVNEHATSGGVLKWKRLWEYWSAYAEELERVGGKKTRIARAHARSKYYSRRYAESVREAVGQAALRRRPEARRKNCTACEGKPSRRTVILSVWPDGVQIRAWDEGAHPRGEHGRFADGGGAQAALDEFTRIIADRVGVPAGGDTTAWMTDLMNSGRVTADEFSIYLALRNRLKAWDESQHPRDPAGSPTGGQFTSGTTHEGSPTGHTDGHPVGPPNNMHTTEKERGGHAGDAKDPIPCGKDLDLAVRALADGMHIQLDQPDQICTFLDKVQVYCKQVKEATGAKPDLNLCNVSVPNTNLFCHDTLGIPRVQMPQLGGLVVPGSRADKELPKVDGEVDLSGKFVEHLKQIGVTVTDEMVLASHLRASQSELVGAKIAKRMKMIERGEYDPNRRHLFISKDNYIIDGHHGWATAIAASSYQHTDLKLPVYRLNIGIGSALYEANKFADEWGIAHAVAHDVTHDTPLMVSHDPEQLKAARQRYDRRRAFQFQWLKTHGKLENDFAADLENVFNAQYRSIIGELKRHGTTKVSADDLFTPGDWGDHIRKVAETHVAKAAAIGARQEYDRATKRTKAADLELSSDIQALLVDLPPDAIDGIRDFIAEEIGQDYWDKLSLTAQDKLARAIEDYVVEGDPESADNITGMAEAIQDALGPEAAKVRSVLTARTETTGAMNAGSREVIKGLIEDGSSKGYEWLSTVDEFVRPTHLEANGQKTTDFF